MINSIFIPIKPMGAVRTTQKTVSSGKSVPYRRYHAYKQEIAEHLKKKHLNPLNGLIHIKKIEFYMPIPKYLEGKIMPMHPHSTKPDIDNAIKGVMDAFNGIAWIDDNLVYKISEASKYYSHMVGVYVEWEQTHEIPEAQIKMAQYRAKAREKAKGKPKEESKKTNSRWK